VHLGAPIAGGVLLGGTMLLASCQLATTRPAFDPLVGTPTAEVQLPVPEATRRLAEVLLADSIPVARVEPRDGYVETPWFDADNGAPARGRPLGSKIVRVRGWVEPGRVGHSDVRIESVYRLLADPSLPGRELERSLPKDHPIAVRVDSVLKELSRRFGEPPPPAETADSQPADSQPVPARTPHDSSANP
jgi:hypothetical protein